MKDAPAVQDVAAIASEPGAPAARRFSRMADGLIFSEILKIAGEIRTLKAAGQAVCDLTVGDFDPKHFPIPDRLRDAITGALAAGRDELPALERHARAARGGAPLLRARAGPRLPGRVLRDRGRLAARHLRPVPHAGATRATASSTRCRAGTTTTTRTWWAAWACPSRAAPGTASCPTRESAARSGWPERACCASTRRSTPPAPRSTRTRCAASASWCWRRTRGASAAGERPLYVMYDQVYWMLCFGGTTHVTPPGAGAGDGALHHLRGRHQQGVRRDGRARGLGRRTRRRDRAHERRCWRTSAPGRRAPSRSAP